ncbi:hypothetical protein JCM9279_006292 [Rhodotorula babjevae]
MYNRNSRQTGANEAPLPPVRRWGGDSGAGAPPPPHGGPHGGPPPMGGMRDGYGGGGGGGGGGYGGGGGGGGYGRDDRGPPPRDDFRSGPAPGGYGMGMRDERGYGGGGSGGGGGGGGYDERGRPTSRFDERPMPSSPYGGGSAPPPSSAGPPPMSDSPATPTGERKRKSRWGDKSEDSAMPVAITGGVQERDLETYATQLRLDEIQRALRTGQVVPPDGQRSPSPPPTYDGHGRRTNTREVRYRKRLEDERMRLVDRQIKLDPNFRPPAEYLMAKRQSSGRPQDKVYIPVKEFPEINFFGLLVGPRGNSLKKMERESGARISIRGKGSVKEGKGRPGHREEDENDELHCLISADTEEKVQGCVKLINSVIETAASVPEGQNDHKRNQLRELAALNGTLRDDENQVCQNCGGLGHRKYDCPEQKNWSANIICRVCGGAGHMARDCTQRRGPGFGGPGGPPGFPPVPGPDGGPPSVAQQFDSEYASLMAELGETTAAPPMSGPGAGGPGGPGPMMGGAPAMQQEPRDEQGNKIPPWRIPSNWNPPMNMQFNRGPPPPPPGQRPPPPPPPAPYGGGPPGQQQQMMGGGGYGGYQQGGYGGGGGGAPYGGGGYQQRGPPQGYGGGPGGGGPPPGYGGGGY